MSANTKLLSWNPAGLHLRMQNSSISHDLSLDVQGGPGHDTARVAIIDTLLSGDFSLLLSGGEGNDMMGATVCLDESSLGSVLANVLGENGKDRLSLLVFAPDTVRLAEALVDGGRGRDSALVTPNVTAQNTESVGHYTDESCPDTVLFDVRGFRARRRGRR